MNKVETIIPHGRDHRYLLLHNACAGTGKYGNVMGYYYLENANPTLGRTAAYGYDSLNRLKSR